MATHLTTLRSVITAKQLLLKIKFVSSKSVLGYDITALYLLSTLLMLVPNGQTLRILYMYTICTAESLNLSN